MRCRIRRDDIDGTRYVSAADLTPQQKRAVWEWIKVNDPVQAAWLQDPAVSGLVKELAAAPRFDLATVRAALGG